MNGMQWAKATKCHYLVKNQLGSILAGSRSYDEVKLSMQRQESSIKATLKAHPENAQLLPLYIEEI